MVVNYPVDAAKNIADEVMNEIISTGGKADYINGITLFVDGGMVLYRGLRIIDKLYKRLYNFIFS